MRPPPLNADCLLRSPKSATVNCRAVQRAKAGSDDSRHLRWELCGTQNAPKVMVTRPNAGSVEQITAVQN
jgi:hypothetical protein